MKFSHCKLLVFMLLLGLTKEGALISQVTVTEEKLVIPTYQVTDPDPNPVFSAAEGTRERREEYIRIR